MTLRDHSTLPDHSTLRARWIRPNSRISPGYVRGEDGVLVVERPKAPIVLQAFKRRDRGASLVEIQALLAENGPTASRRW